MNVVGIESLAFLCFQGTDIGGGLPFVLLFSCGAQGVAQT